MDSPPPTCPFCGKEIAFYEISLGGETRKIRPQVCPCAEAQADLARRIEETENDNRRNQALDILRQSELETPAYGSLRFSNWDPARNKGRAAKVLTKVIEYTDNVALGAENWAIFYGNYGTGKTHLAVAALRKIAIERLWQPHIIVWPELCDRTRESWGNKNLATFEAAEWNKARFRQVLVIDDLDKTKTDQRSMEKLFTVINTRYTRKLPTIITMNRKYDELWNEWTTSPESHLRDTGKAVLSRIGGQLVAEIEFVGQDQRLV